MKYDIAYSLGADCAAALYMKRNFLRLCSGPFDWLCGADFNTRIDMILNGFENFMEQKDFQLIPKPTHIATDTRCDYYKNIKTGFYFYHDFPAGQPLKTSFAPIKEKYERRIKRFYSNLTQKQNILCIFHSHKPLQNKSAIVQKCLDVQASFKKQIHFLIIEHDPLKSPGEPPAFLQPADGIFFYSLHTEDQTGSTLGLTQALDPIYARYVLKGARARKLRYFLRKLSAGFLCLFCPLKKGRAYIRKVLVKEFK